MTDIKTMSDIYEVLRHMPYVGETETVNKMFNLFSELQIELLKEVLSMVDSVRNDCRNSDDQWDKGDESNRIKDLINELMISITNSTKPL